MNIKGIHSINLLLIFLFISAISMGQQHIENVTYSSGEYNYIDITSIISPYDTTEDVNFSNSSKVTYKAPLIILNNNFNSGNYSSGGYFKAYFPFDVYANTQQNCDEEEGVISLDIHGGVSPFSYSWSNSGTNDTMHYTGQGVYSVTVSDDRGKTSTATFNVLSDYYSQIYWTDSVGVETSSDTIRKIYDTGWGNAGAASRNTLQPGNDGFLRYRILLGEYNDNDSYRRFLGLSETNTNPNYNTIDYAFFFDEDSVFISESGTIVGSSAKYFPYDLFEIYRKGDTIFYFHNEDTLHYTIDPSISEKKLIADISLFNEEAYFTDIKASFCTGSPVIEYAVTDQGEYEEKMVVLDVAGGKSPFTYEWSNGDTSDTIYVQTGIYIVSVTDYWDNLSIDTVEVYGDIAWTHLRNMEIDGDTLTSLPPEDINEHNASSLNKLSPFEDGAFTYTILDCCYDTSLTKNRAIGISEDDYCTAVTGLDYAFAFMESELKIRDNGAWQVTGLTYNVGDVLKMKRVNDTIIYTKNDTILRQVSVDSTNEFYIHAIMNESNGRFVEIQTSFPIPLQLSFAKDQSHADSLSATLSPFGGISEYEYIWSNSDTTETIEYIDPGNYLVTITDDYDSTYIASILIDRMYPITWDELDSVEVVSDTLRKTGTTETWTAGAFSINILEGDQDGYIEYSITEGDYTDNYGFDRYMGLSDVNTDAGYTSIDHGIYFNNHMFRVWDNSAYRTDTAGYKTGDMFQIEREADTVRYYLNGTALYNVTVDGSKDLFLDASIYDSSAYFSNIQASFAAPMRICYDIEKACGDTSGTIALSIENGNDPYQYLWDTAETNDTLVFTSTGTYTVTVTDSLGTEKAQIINIPYDYFVHAEWIEQDSVTVAGDSIVCTAVSETWTSGAISENYLESHTDGFVEYYVTEDDFNNNISNTRYFGLSDRNEDNTASTMDYAFWFDSDTLKITENGTMMEDSLSWSTYDRLSIFRVDDEIIYMKNDDTLRAIATNAGKELRVDVALKEEDSYFKEIKTSFCEKELQMFITNLTMDCGEDEGIIEVIPEGGTSPYTYSWSTGSTTDTIHYTVSGNYIVTVTDYVSETYADTITIDIDDILTYVEWTSLDSVTISGDTLMKDASATDTTWNSGASSKNLLYANQDGYLEYIITEEKYYDNSNKQSFLGLSDEDEDSDYSTIDYAYYFNEDELRIYEKGIYRNYDINYAPGDVLRIYRSGDYIYYTQNGDTLRTASTDPSKELVADASFYNTGSYFEGVKVSFCALDLDVLAFDVQKDCDSTFGVVRVITEGGTSPYTYSWSNGSLTDTIHYSASGNYYVTVTDDDSNTTTDTINVNTDNTYANVVWTELDSVEVSGDTIRSFQSMMANIGSATSVNTLESGQDGSVLYLVTKDDYYENSSDKYRYLGFIDPDQSDELLDYGFYFNRYELRIIENDSTPLEDLQCKPGDLLQVKRSNDSIIYLNNSDTLRTIITASERDLKVKAMLTDSLAYFAGIKTTFCRQDLDIFTVDYVKDCEGNDGIATVKPFGGTSPYTYAWSTSSTTDTIHITSSGNYYITVTDDSSNTTIDTLNVTIGNTLAYLEWTDMDSTEVDSILIQSTQTIDGWSSGAASVNTMDNNTNGYIEYLVTKEDFSDNWNKTRAFGLSEENTDENYETIEYAFYFSGSLLNIIDSGTVQIDSIDYAPGDLLKIQRSGDTIKYWKNDDLQRQHISLDIYEKQLITDLSFYSAGAYFQGIKSSFCPLQLEILAMEATKACDVDSGLIEVHVNGGVPPYEYDWSTSDTTESIQYANTGTYYVTVTDSWSNTVTDTLIISDNQITQLSWHSFSDFDTTAYTLTKTDTAGNWYNAAVSENMIFGSEDGYTEYIVQKQGYSDNKTYSRKFGLSDVVSDTTLINYAFYFDQDSVKITENDTIKGSIYFYEAGDKFSIERDVDTIRYWMNETELRKLITDSSKIMAVKVNIYDEEAYFEDLKANFCPVTPLSIDDSLYKPSADSLGDVYLTINGGVEPYEYLWSTSASTSYILDQWSGTYWVTITDSIGYSLTQPIFVMDSVAWTDLVNTYINSDSLINIDTISRWKSGAGSENVLAAGEDGAIQYIINDNDNDDKIRSIGLSYTIESVPYISIDYNFYFKEDTIKIYEFGYERGEYGTFNIDDEFQIRRIGDTIQYVKNDTVLRESLTDTTKALYVEARLFTDSSYFKGVKASFKPESPMIVDYHIKSETGDSLFVIELDISGGTPPLTYEWSTESDADTSEITLGAHHVTVTDYLGNITIQPVVVNNVIWTDLDSTGVSEDTLAASIDATAWHAGAATYNTLAAGSNGFVYYNETSSGYTDNYTKHRYLGFSETNINETDTTIEYALYFDQDTLRVVESGVVIDTLCKYNSGDLISIHRRDTFILYMVNDSVYHISNDSLLIDKELLVDISFKNDDAYFEGVKTTFTTSEDLLVDYTITNYGDINTITMDVEGGVTPYTYIWNTGQTTDTLGNLYTGKYIVTITDYAGNRSIENIYVTEDITWITLDSAACPSDSLYSTATVDGWNSGALADNLLNAEKDGAIEYLVTDSNYYYNHDKIRVLGLSAYGELSDYDEIDYAFYFDKDSTVNVIENGTIREDDITFRPDDKFRIVRENGYILYYKNEELLYSTNAGEEDELYVDASIYDTDAFFKDVKASFIRPVHIAYHFTGIDTINDMYDVGLDVSRGFPPYSYSWTTGSYSDTSSISLDNVFTATVIDSLEYSTTEQIVATKVSWTDFYKAEESGDTLMRDGTAGDYGGAVSENRLVAKKDGFVFYHESSDSYTDNENYIRVFGLSEVNTDATWQTIDYAFYLTNNQLSIYENGVSQLSAIDYNENDIFQIQRLQDSILYMWNDSVLRTTYTDKSKELMVDASLLSLNSYLDNLVTSFSSPIEIDYNVVHRYRSSLGSISVDVSGGMPDYSYLWSNGDTTTTLADLYNAEYILTVTDAWNHTETKEIQVLRDVIWTELDSASTDTDTLFADLVVNGWNSAAGSENVLIANEDGFVEYLIDSLSYYDNLSKNRAFGLSHTYSTTYGGIDYVFGFVNGTIRIYEKGSLIGNYGAFAIGDRLQIERAGSKINYYMNDSLLQSSSTSPSQSLLINAVFYHTGSYFDAVKTSFSPPEIVAEFDVTNNDGTGSGVVEMDTIYGGVSPYTYLWNIDSTGSDISNLIAGAYTITITDSIGSKATFTSYVLADIIWDDLDSTSVGTDTLYSSLTEDGWNSRANSSCRLEENTDGMIEYTVTSSSDTTKLRAFGLAEKDLSTNPYSINYRMFLDGNKLKLFNGGVLLDDDNNYTIGDVLRIERSGTSIKYIKNNTILDSVTVENDHELMASAAFYEEDAYFNGILTSFSDSSCEVPEEEPILAGNTLVLNPTADAIVVEDYPDSTYIDVDLLGACYNTPSIDNAARGFVNFNLNSIPENAVITSAILRLYGNGHANSNASYLKRADTLWYEDSITWNNQPDGISTDKISLAESDSSDQNYEVNIIDYVRMWVNDTITNYGMKIELQSESGDNRRMSFVSSHDTVNTDKHPTLTVSYYVPVRIAVTIYPNKDVLVTNSAPTNNYGNSVYFEASADTVGIDEASRSLVYFDLSVVPPNATIDSAKYTLSGLSHNGENACSLKRITESWDEDTITWNDLPSVIESDSINLEKSTSSSQDYEMDVTDLVQQWSDRTTENYGFILKMNDENEIGQLRFASTDYTDSTLHPKLEIWYSVQPLEIAYDIQTDTIDTTAYISLRTTGGIPPYTIQWSTGETRSNMEDMSLGLYLVTVTDAWGNYAVRQVIYELEEVSGGNQSEAAERNWEKVKYYNYLSDGGIITEKDAGENIVYYDYLGRQVQSLSKIQSLSDKVIGAQVVFDAFGRPVLNTLPTVFTQSDLSFKDYLITNMNGNNYSYSDFDQENSTEMPGSGEINNPRPVSSYCALGKYYSDENTDELYVPETQYPYSRVEYLKHKPGSVYRTSSAGDYHRMGSGHEVKQFSLPATSELDYVLGYKSTNIINEDLFEENESNGTFQSFNLKHQRNATKQIMIDPDGKINIKYIDQFGKLIAACNGNGENEEDFLSTQAVFTFDNYNEGINYIDIHLPIEKDNNLKLIYDGLLEYGSYTIINLETNETVLDSKSFDIAGNQGLINAETNANIDVFEDNGEYFEEYRYNFITLPAGFYRVIYDFIRDENEYYHYQEEYINNEAKIEFDLNYYNFSIYYYDDAQRMKKAVPPQGIDEDYAQTIGDVQITKYVDYGQFVNDYPGSSPESWNIVSGNISNTTCDRNIELEEDDDLHFYNLKVYFDEFAKIDSKYSGNPDYQTKVQSTGGESELEDPWDIHYIREETIINDYDIGFELICENSAGSEEIKKFTGTVDMLTKEISTITVINGIYSDAVITYENSDNHNKTFSLTPEEAAQVARVKLNIIYIGKDNGNNSYDWWADANSVPINSQNCVNVLHHNHSITPIGFDCVTEIPDMDELGIALEVEKHKILGGVPEHTMVSENEYNSMGWLMSSYTPDAGLKEFKYRKDGLLRFSQDTLQYVNHVFSYIEYDDAGRIIETGECNHVTLGTDFDVIDPDADYVFDGTNSTDRAFISYDIPDTDFESESGLLVDDFKQMFLMGKTSKTWNDNSITWYSYDDIGNIEWVVIHLNGMSETTDSADGTKTIHYEYDFAGNLIKTTYQQGETEEFSHIYEYDEDMRLVRVETEGYSETKLQAIYEYYMHGPLKRVELAPEESGGQVIGGLQGIDYVYNINGLLKSINDPNVGESAPNGNLVDPGKDNIVTNGFETDVFGMSLDYYTGDYVRAPELSADGTYINYGDINDENHYSGTVRSVRWNTRGQTTSTTLPEGSHWMYKYNYDNLNRLTEANFGTYQQNYSINSGLYAYTAIEASKGDNSTSTSSDNEIIQVADALATIQTDDQGQSTNINFYNVYGLDYADPGNSSYINNNTIITSSITNSGVMNYNMNMAISQAYDAETSETDASCSYYTQDEDDSYRVWDITYNDEDGEISGGNNGSVFGNNGNIASLKRNAYDAGTGNVKMDELSYYYNQGTNQLNQVVDAVNAGTYYSSSQGDDFSGTANFTYDAIGRMTGNDGDSHYFKYNVYNQVTNVYNNSVMDNVSRIATYVYNERGGRIYKLLYNSGTPVNETWYVRDINGNILGVYNKEIGSAIELQEVPVYGASRLGSIELNEGSIERYNYELTDHLGNVRAVICPDEVDPDNELEIISVSDYYPFGSLMDGRLDDEDYIRFGYQGQFAEKDPETGYNAFELRLYDSRLARWQIPDPYGQHFSPYLAMGNNPVSMVDPDGGLDGWSEWSDFVSSGGLEEMFNGDVGPDDPPGSDQPGGGGGTYDCESYEGWFGYNENGQFGFFERYAAWYGGNFYYSFSFTEGTLYLPQNLSYSIYTPEFVSRSLTAYNGRPGSDMSWVTGWSSPTTASYFGNGGNGGNMILRQIEKGGKIATYGEGLVGLARIGMIEYRTSLSVMNKIGSFSSFSSNYKILTKVGTKILGRVGIIGSSIGILLDYQLLQSGKIGIGRFGFRVGSLASSVAIGFVIGGPWGAVVGAAFSGISAGCEYFYDSALKPIEQEFLYQMWNMEDKLNSLEWYPGKY